MICLCAAAWRGDAWRIQAASWWLGIQRAARRQPGLNDPWDEFFVVACEAERRNIGLPGSLSRDAGRLETHVSAAQRKRAEAQNVHRVHTLQGFAEGSVLVPVFLVQCCTCFAPLNVKVDRGRPERQIGVRQYVDQA